MAKLVGICRSVDYPYERRQIPLVVDDKLTMVIQFTDSCIGCEQAGIKMKELDRFVQKFQMFSTDEVSMALKVTNKEIFNLLAQMVSCVGCRRSVERLYSQLVDSGHPALEPLVVTHNSVLSIKREYLFDPKALYALFYVHGSKLNLVMEAIPKSKKNKRCILHSLDTHKVKSLGTWMDVWDVMSKECREEVVLVECDNLMETIENYLRKHRFCAECKAKVLRAYSLLLGEVDQTTEKGFCPALYEGLKCCTGERHIHVSCETDFMAHLISRAEPELSGTRRERHAKTLDIAQEEVLTCLGIYLYARLHKIWQKLRAEEQTWQILYYVGVDALKKNFEVAQENKQGISNLELMCQELLEEEQAKEQRKEQKRQRKKGKKKRGQTKVDNDNDNEYDKEKENCHCEDEEQTLSICSACDDNSNHLMSQPKESSLTVSRCRFLMDNDVCGHRCNARVTVVNSRSSRSDCGYSSGQEGCDSCSAQSSQDGSDVVWSEGICNHDADSPGCHDLEYEECKDCLQHKCNVSPQHSCNSSCDLSGEHCHSREKCAAAPSLQEMLEASCSTEIGEDFISEEEIQRFKANQTSVNSKRQELRETLRLRFANMQRRGCIVPNKADGDGERGDSQITKDL